MGFVLALTVFVAQAVAVWTLEASEATETRPLRSAEQTSVSLAENVEREMEGTTRRLATSNTCQLAQDTPGKLDVELDPYTLKGVFNCGQADSPTLEPQEPNQCFENAECTQPSSGGKISAVMGVEGTVTKDSNSPVNYTISLANFPTKKKEVFLKCKSSSGDKTCIVTAKVADPPTDPSKCALNKTVALEVTASQKSVSFVCDGQVATPTSLDLAIQYSGAGDCTGRPTKLATLLPGATLAKNSSSYTFKVETLPKSPLQLCYICDYTDRAKDAKACSVTVTVAAAAPENADKTSTTTATTGSATVMSGHAGVVAAFTVASISVAV